MQVQGQVFLPLEVYYSAAFTSQKGTSSYYVSLLIIPLGIPRV
jgi:hypothetical protein